MPPTQEIHLHPNQAHLQPGFRLDRYELLFPLAQGGMATVWVARHQGKHGFEKLVAIKTVLPQYADDPEFQSMFIDEARIAARIRHPNVAEILDIGEENHTTFLVMEWVDGDSLARLYNAIVREKKRFPAPIVARILADACHGLHAAHELRDEHGRHLGVVHRDVSPQNVLVAMSGVAKVIDFGVAKAAQRMTQETSAGLVKGKIQYASPEQAMGGTLDGRSDVWALGAILYQMLAGRLPYDGENQLQTLHLITSGEPPPPLPPHVPAPVQNVVRKALAHRPEDRFATALEMAHALEALRPTATQAEVAKLVQEVLGARAAQRKKDVADALANVAAMRMAAPPSGLSTPSSPSHAVYGGPGMPPPRGPMGSQPMMPMAPPSMPAGMTPYPPQQYTPGFTPPPVSPQSQPSLQATVMPSEVGARSLSAVHYVVAGLATIVTVGVWGGVAATAMGSGSTPTGAAPAVASEAPKASATEAPKPPPVAASTQAAPPATTAPPPATTAAAPPATTAAAPPPTTAAVAPPVVPGAPPGGTATTKKPPPTKKKKVDDGF